MAKTSILAFAFSHKPISALRSPDSLPKAANMNGAPVVNHAVLVETLRHFAKYGLSAADKALETAHAAFDRGDEAAASHWLEIGRALDRRRAARLERELTPAE